MTVKVKRAVGRRTKAEAELTREALLDAAEEVFLAKGVGRSTLEDVAQRAGVTRGALYWHFHNKQDLFEAMLSRVQLPLEELSREFGRQRPGDPLATLEELCLHSLHSLANDPQKQRVCTILFHRFESLDDNLAGADPLGEAQRRALAVFESLFRRAHSVDQLREELRPDVVAEALLAYLIGLYSSWLAAPQRFSLADKASVMLRVFFAGLRRPPDLE